MHRVKLDSSPVAQLGWQYPRPTYLAIQKCPFTIGHRGVHDAGNFFVGNLSRKRIMERLMARRWSLGGLLRLEGFRDATSWAAVVIENKVVV